MQLKSIVPGFYKQILHNRVMGLDVVEKAATCDNCLRARDKRFSYTYQPDLKCCTFHPYLPNYAVGALLEMPVKTHGIQEIERKIKSDEFTLPMGILAPFDYQFKFLTKDESDFGNEDSLLCPYYDRTGNRCSIWQYRGTVCTSFYCRSDYGQNGLKFWAVMSDYLSYVEMALAEECLVQLDFSPRDLSDQLLYLNKRDFEADEVSQKTIDPVSMKKFWNGYTDRVEFYKKCFAIVQKLDRNQFKEILGNQGLELEKEVLDYADRRKN